MTTEQTAQQLELAAQILRTGHPFEVRHDASDKWHASLSVNPAQAALQDWHIRPILATPPDSRPLHNPDNFTAEQVGVGYRLVCYDDKTTEDKLEKWMSREWVVVHTIGQLSFRHCQSTYRLPLSVPWPETKPDPYAELKKAHAEGKVIQCITVEGNWVDCTPLNPPRWNILPENYRIKPEPTFQLPPSPPGMQWHENTWEEEMLPKGIRPLCRGETICEGDEYFAWDCGPWKTIANQPHRIGQVVVADDAKMRTHRPLTFTHAGKTWTWHRPGDPMPITHDKDIYFLRSDLVDLGIGKATSRTWDASLSPNSWIIGWRYADEKKTVLIGPEDVPMGSAIYEAGWPKKTWELITGIELGGVRYGSKYMTWEELEKQSKINRSIPLTGKWNPDAWEPCHKIVSENG